MEMLLVFITGGNEAHCIKFSSIFALRIALMCWFFKHTWNYGNAVVIATEDKIMFLENLERYVLNWTGKSALRRPIPS